MRILRRHVNKIARLQLCTIRANSLWKCSLIRHFKGKHYLHLFRGEIRSNGSSEKIILMEWKFKTMQFSSIIRFIFVRSKFFPSKIIKYIYATSPSHSRFLFFHLLVENFVKSFMRDNSKITSLKIILHENGIKHDFVWCYTNVAL